MTRFANEPPKDKKPDIRGYFGQKPNVDTDNPPSGGSGLIYRNMKTGIILNSDRAHWRERISFLERHMASFEELSEHDDDNHPGMRIEMFTVLTQHIYGRSVTECIDKGLKIEKAWSATISPVYHPNKKERVQMSERKMWKFEYSLNTDDSSTPARVMFVFGKDSRAARRDFYSKLVSIFTMTEVPDDTPRKGNGHPNS